MADHADWPKMQRRLAQVLRAVVYTFAACAALGVLVWEPAAVVEVIGMGGLGVLGGTGLLAGLTALVGTLAYAWKVEWVAAWWVAAAFGAYTAIEWWMVYLDHAGRAPTAAVLTALTAAVAARGVDLWVFSLEVTQARRARVRAWRRVAGLDS